MSWNPPSNPPSVPGHFLLGNTLQYVRNPLRFLLSAARTNGDVVQLRLAGETCVLLAHPSDIEGVLCTRQDDFCKDKLVWRSPLRLACRALLPLGKRSLYSAADDARRQPGFWRRERKLVQPAFQSQYVKQYQAVMRDEAERFIAAWKPGEPVDLAEEFTALTLIILARCLFGADLRQHAQAMNRALNILVAGLLRSQTASQLSRSLPLPSNIAMRQATRLLDDRIMTMIRLGREGQAGGELLRRLLEARDESGQPATDQSIRNEILTILLAAHKTSALSTAYGLHMLANDKDRLHRAIGEVGNDRFEYLDWVMRESNRLYPAAWLIGREARHDCEIGGFSIAAGTQLLISQWVVHRDPRWYDHPDEFRPERWAEILALRNNPRCAYVAFGHGQHACIGEIFSTEESLQLIGAALRMVAIQPVASRPLRLRAAETLTPVGGLWIQVGKRSQTPIATRAAPASA